ncbi:MAG: carboxylating nicotinate-nucleotide diphosphorylase [Phycisphaerae bacterium]
MDLTSDTAVTQLIELARQEDVGSGDISTSLVPHAGKPAAFSLWLKEPGVVCGVAIAEQVLRAYDPSLRLHWNDGVFDGCAIEDVPHVLATINGPLGALLTSERVLLNFLQRLCGIATLTQAYVAAVAGTGAAVYDTRKTTPGWRRLEKYAVRCGGGKNHRMGLFDAVLIKENHFTQRTAQAMGGDVFRMLNELSMGDAKPGFIEVEAETLEQLEALLSVTGIDVILLDNFALDELTRAVQLRDVLGLKGKVALEASGGIDLTTVGQVARTGVERISVGAITHSATATDLSLERV